MNDPATDPLATAPAGRLFRHLSTLVGSVAILVCVATIAVKRPPLPSAVDGVLGLNVLAMVFVRGLDVQHYSGRTHRDGLASLAHWRRYMFTLVGVTLAAWLLAHLIAGSFTGAS